MSHLTKEAHWYTFSFVLFSFGLSPHAYTDAILKPKRLSIFSVPSGTTTVQSMEASPIFPLAHVLLSPI